MTETNSQRILILTDSEEKSKSKAICLTRSNHNVKICTDFNELCEEIQLGVGALMLAQEVFNVESLHQLTFALRTQPGWAHIPIIVMLNPGELSTSNEQWLQILEPLGNVTLVERPVSEQALTTIVRSAVSYRLRQYQVRDLLSQLEISNRAKSDFLANMSHEFRTPLCAILGFCELLDEHGTGPGERARYIATIRRNGLVLAALIDGILDLTSLESGPIKIDPCEFILADALHDVLAALSAEASQRGLSLRLERYDEFSVIRTDLTRFKQIFSQIVGNAIKFSSQGLIAIRILGKASEGILRIEVEDSGIGISQEHMENLFQPFAQADSSSTRNYGGTGLGLVLSRKLARALGGDLKLQWSIPGGGSCFEISLRVVDEVTVFPTLAAHS